MPELRSVLERLHGALRDCPQAQLPALLAMVPLPVFIKDAGSRILLMNPACEQQWGVTQSQVRGTRGDPYFQPGQQQAFLANDRAAFITGRQLVVEETLWCPRHGAHRTVLSFKHPAYDEAGRPQLLLCMSIDITESKANELALQRTLDQLRSLSGQQLDAEESQRRRLALDLHDELAQNLAAIKLDVAMLHSRTGPQHPRLHQRAGRVLDTLDASLRTVREVINALHPSTLELGLEAALDWLLKETARSHGLDCGLALAGDAPLPQLDAQRTAGIFRMVQAALGAICDHAGASRVQVTLRPSAGALGLTVQDDGDGLPGPEAAVRAALQLRERVAAWGGEMLLTRRAGQGSTLLIHLPLAPDGAA
ncbi:PAS domain-containing protein [Oxalobacteraceae bacterium A2-2]